MDIDARQFRVTPGDAVDLAQWPTRVAPLYDSESDYQAQIDRHIARLSALQQMFYASGRHALLLIFQGMDAAGKDGTIEHVMSGISPQGCEVFSFKQPTPLELKHDFLWRSTRVLPERGKIGIFNRSYYEEVLVVRVHPDMLCNEGLTDASHDQAETWRRRYRSVNAMEQHLQANGTRILKFYLHLSAEEQKKRFLSRIDDPRKNWKLSKDDIIERRFWTDYIQAYEECLTATSSDDAPCYVVPADEKENSRLVVSQIILDALDGIRMSYPATSAAREGELQAIRAELLSQK